MSGTNDNPGGGSENPTGNLIGFWDFVDGAENNDTGLDDGIAQDGAFIGGAITEDGHLVLSGRPDRFDVIAEDNGTPNSEDIPFQIAEGRIVTEFMQEDNSEGAFQTVISRGEFFDSASEGYLGLDVGRDGSVQVTHISNGISILESTAPGFSSVGDDIRITYEWSFDDGGRFVVENLTQDTSYETDTAAGVDLNIGDDDGQAFSFGARENVDEVVTQDPGFIKYFDGKIDYVAVYDGLGDEPPVPPGPDRDGIITDGDDSTLIDVDYDGDPDGDRVDNMDAILPRVGSDDDVIRAFGGDDTVEAGEGRDIVEGGTGDDVINTDGDATPGAPDAGFPGAPGIPAIAPDPDPTDDNDRVFAGPGNDDVSTGDDADTIEGGAGDDTLDGGLDNDRILGGDGDDSIIGGQGNDDVNGGEGDDYIDTADRTIVPLPDLGFPSYNGLPEVPADPLVDNDRDVVDGAGGNDTIVTGDDADSISGGAGDDSIDAGLDADTVSGGEGDDDVIGGEGSDSILGNAGDDTLYGGLGADAPDATNIPDLPAGPLADPRPDNGRDTIDGGEGNDVIFGQDDNDSLIGGAGDDLIDGGIDQDTISGGTGDDGVFGSEGADSLSGDEGDDLVGGGFDLDADTLSGGADRDVLGARANDIAIGGEAGDDFDVLVTGGGIPIVEYDPDDPEGESGTVSLLDEDLNVAGTVEFSEIEGVVAIDINGPPGVTTVDPVSGPGSSATDVLNPSAVPVDGVVDGTDAGELIDTGYTGDPDGDLVDGDDAVYPLENEEDIIRAGAGDDTVRAGEDGDLVYGAAGDDLIFGEAGGDGLSGGDGDDTLSGGEGADVVTGGTGDDEISGDATLPGDAGDQLYGNFGDDTFTNVGPGDLVVGGEDPDGADTDTLDLRGTLAPGERFVIEEAAGDPEAGTVRYFDDAGGEVGTLSYREIETVIPCFTPGTMIATPRGERAVETLEIGDKIITRDNGIQEIRWLGARTLNQAEMMQARHMQPVLIRQGALGNGLPERDMMVSPNHRVLVSNDKIALYLDESEVLIAAKHLVGRPGIEAVTVPTVTYIHFMFDQHEVVLSDGAWTESFQPGDLSLAGIGEDQRQEIFELFPELETAEGVEGYQAARRSLKRHEAMLVMG